MSAFDDETTIQRAVAGLAVRQPYLLLVEEGGDLGTRLEVDPSRPSRALLGKSPVCELRLSDRSVSRRHASVEVCDARLRLVDLESTNGTFVNGTAIREAFLTGGEAIRIGDTVIRVERRPVVTTQRAKGAPSSFGGVFGRSEAMRRLYPLCERLAASTVPVIIEGETGTGKEQLAQALHECGPRAEHPFVVFDCTAVAPNLIESELFGHERGAFTGAVDAHRGVFERAEGGTLLIDEIGDLSLPLQAKLLRAVERLQVTRIGGSRTLRVDVRILAATRRDLDRQVQVGRFRDDLFHRLAITRIELPPLRDRQGDVTLLARRFWQEFGGDPGSLPEDVLAAWEDDRWPGNVRELRNAVARRIALGDLVEPIEARSSFAGAKHAVGATGDSIAAILALGLPYSDARKRANDEFDQRYVEHLLNQHDGNVTRAAAAAGVGRRYFQRIKARRREPGDD